MKCGRPHFIVSTAEGHPACTAARSKVKIGCANAGDESMYLSMRGSRVAMSIVPPVAQRIVARGGSTVAACVPAAVALE